MGRKILPVDDDVKTREVVWILLEGEGYRVDEAVDGMSAVFMADGIYNLITPDMMMPGRFGFFTYAEIRKKSVVLTLSLTARTQDSDETMGFGAGRDDYPVKPSSYTELTIRVRVMIRRYHVYKSKTEEKEDDAVMVKDPAIQRAWNEVRRVGGEPLLANSEYRILLFSACNRGRTFTIENIYESVWEEPFFYSADNMMMVYIRNLREKLEADPKSPKYVVNVWGRGYRVR